MRRSVPLACTLLRMNMPRIWRPASSSESACAMDTPSQQIVCALELDHSRAAATRRFSFTRTYPPQFALRCTLQCVQLSGSRTGSDKKSLSENAMKRRMVVAAGFAALIGVLPAARAAEFPTKPITLVLGFAPGGPSDVMARILTKRLEELLKQPVVIENRAGAGGGIAANAVARAAPDGYTILLATGSSLAINVSLYKNLGYDPE